MRTKSNSALTPLSKILRKNLTKEERKLWYEFLRDYPIRFYRQKVMGQYIVDFYCAKAKLVVELDGSQHYENAEHAKDLERTAFLEQYGLLVLRFPNNELLQNFEGCCTCIDEVVKRRI